MTLRYILRNMVSNVTSKEKLDPTIHFKKHRLKQSIHLKKHGLQRYTLRNMDANDTSWKWTKPFNLYFIVKQIPSQWWSYLKQEKKIRPMMSYFGKKKTLSKTSACFHSFQGTRISYQHEHGYWTIKIELQAIKQFP